MGLIVSKVCGKRRYALVMSAYVSFFRRSAASDGDAAFADGWVTYEAATVSVYYYYYIIRWRKIRYTIRIFVLLPAPVLLALIGKRAKLLFSVFSRSKLTAHSSPLGGQKAL